jgi:hypothetical protein
MAYRSGKQGLFYAEFLPRGGPGRFSPEKMRQSFRGQISVFAHFKGEERWLLVEERGDLWFQRAGPGSAPANRDVLFVRGFRSIFRSEAITVFAWLVFRGENEFLPNDPSQKQGVS